MRILALERELEGAEAGAFAPHLRDEAARLWALYREGLVREAYFRQDWHGAVLVLECAGADEARSALDTLPLVREGLITFDLIPLGPYTGFERLFEKGA